MPLSICHKSTIEEICRANSTSPINCHFGLIPPSILNVGIFPPPVFCHKSTSNFGTSTPTRMMLHHATCLVKVTNWTISIYIKFQRFFPLCANSSWTNEHIWTNDTSLEPAWHVDGLFWLKISIPTAMEWPGTQTCPKTWTIANNSETMGRIEILRALFTLQLLILSTGTHFQRVFEPYMVTKTYF